MKLYAFTLIRDPLERMVSYFHYWRRTYPSWRDCCSYPGNERQLLLSGDLEGWLEYISKYRNGSRTGLGVAGRFQYQYLNDDLDAAVETVTAMSTAPAEAAKGHGSFRVLPLLTECFDASVYLLSSIFPDLVSREEAEAFLNDTRISHANRRRRNQPSWENGTSAEVAGMEPVREEYDFEKFERDAREKWLVSDYRFYDAAAAQFRDLLSSPSLPHFNSTAAGAAVPRSVADNCFSKLSRGRRGQ